MDENNSRGLNKMETTEGQPRMLSEDQQQPQMPKVHFVDGREYGLPEGWIVEQRPRTSAKYFGKLDQVIALYSASLLLQ